jgi:outer membrane receptor protein involved in Fe transport
VARETGRWTLTGGGRIDRWRIHDGFLRESVIATGASLNDLSYSDRSGWEPTARAGIAFRPAGAITLRTAAYLGWRLPTLNELYRPFRVGRRRDRRQCRPCPRAAEGNRSGHRIPAAEQGADRHHPLRQPPRRRDRERDAWPGSGVFPGVGFVAAGGEFRQRRNLDAIEVTGIEVDGQLAYGAWTLSGGYSFADAEVRASGPALALSGLRPAQTPRHSLAGTMAWSGFDGGRLSLTGRYTGAQFETTSTSSACRTRSPSTPPPRCRSADGCTSKRARRTSPTSGSWRASAAPAPSSAPRPAPCGSASATAAEAANGCRAAPGGGNKA